MDDLIGETISLFAASQVCSWFMYCCRLPVAVSCLGCWDMTVRSSAYDMGCVFGSEGNGIWCI